MKLLAVLIISVVAFVSAQGPSKISSNNVGDIINVDVNAKAKIDNNIDATVVNVLLRFLNAQLISLNRDGDNNGNDDGPPNWPGVPTLPPNLPTLPPA